MKGSRLDLRRAARVVGKLVGLAIFTIVSSTVSIGLNVASAYMPILLLKRIGISAPHSALLASLSHLLGLG